MKKANETEAFSFVIGSYWEDGMVSSYAYGKEVWHGTAEDAEHVRSLLSEKADKDLKIFKLVEINQDGKAVQV